MKRLGIIVLAAQLSCAALFWVTSPSASFADEPAAAPLVLKSRSFKFPYRGDLASKAQFVRLYVSTNRGATWRVATEQPISSTELPFEGTEDGEHWFTTLTSLELPEHLQKSPQKPENRSAEPSPVDQELPNPVVQRKVIVDTLGPEIRITAEADTSGGVAGTLKLHDPRQVASIRLLYATDVGQKWVSVESPRLDADGRFRFQARDDWKEMTLHVTATDSLGNVSVEAQTVRRPRVASASPIRLDSPMRLETTPKQGPTRKTTIRLATGPKTAPILTAPLTRSGPLSDGSPGDGPLGSESDATPSTQLPTSGLPVKTTQQGVEIVGPENTTRPPVSSTREQEAGAAPQIPFGSAWLKPQQPAASNPTFTGADNSPKTESALPEILPETSGVFDTDAPVENKRRTLKEALRPMQPAVDNSTAGENADTGFETIPTPSPSETPEDRRRYEAQRAEQATREQQTRFDVAQLSRSIPTRFNDSNRFSLEYQLEAVGASGVESVELYGSLDGGQSWRRWGADPDRTSPFDIETKGEGVFAFRIVVLGNNGLASPRPLPGDPPDIAVIVDQTKPTIRITSAQYGEGNRTGSLVIRYECDDEHLMNRPVAIAFSESLEGPWTTIAAGLRNDGLYVWPADPKLPRRIYLRIDATDQAGNVGSYLLDQPIETQGLAPRARILGFQSQ